MNVLYRHFASDGQLLYVGITMRFEYRTKEHRNSKWFHLVSNITIEHFDTRDSCLDAETLAINVEKPIFNIQKANRPHLDIAKLATTKTEHAELKALSEKYKISFERISVFFGLSQRKLRRIRELKIKLTDEQIEKFSEMTMRPKSEVLSVIRKLGAKYAKSL